MMFAAPRFIAVDDKKEHLEAILSSFQQIGTPCMGILFDPEHDIDKAHFRGVRCIFMDLHLLSGAVVTDHKADYARIQTILEDSITSSGGPFVLVIWTEFPNLKDGLIAYLEKNLDPAAPHTWPLAVLSMSKAEFLDLTTGALKDPEKLVQAVKGAILENTQLAALLEWETDVSTAAGATLASLLNLVPSDKRTAADFSGALDLILSRLAKEAVGSSHVDASPRSAISTALAPILSDRILNQDVTEDAKKIWGKAVTRHTDPKLEKASAAEAGEINRMLHLAVPGSEVLLPTDWGAVVAWPFAWDDEVLADLTGLSKKAMMCQEFKLRSDAMDKCRPVLVRVGAACDYAQNNPGPITYLFGLDIPESAKRQESGGKTIKPSDAVWISPIFLMPQAAEPSRLHVHIRFPQTHLPAKTEDWQVICRLREQLLMHLISAASTHVARPGIVQLFAAQ